MCPLSSSSSSHSAFLPLADAATCTADGGGPMDAIGGWAVVYRLLSEVFIFVLILQLFGLALVLYRNARHFCDKGRKTSQQQQQTQEEEQTVPPPAQPQRQQQQQQQDQTPAANATPAAHHSCPAAPAKPVSSHPAPPSPCPRVPDPQTRSTTVTSEGKQDGDASPKSAGGSPLLRSPQGSSECLHAAPQPQVIRPAFPVKAPVPVASAMVAPSQPQPPQPMRGRDGGEDLFLKAARRLADEERYHELWELWKGLPTLSQIPSKKNALDWFVLLAEATCAGGGVTPDGRMSGRMTPSRPPEAIDMGELETAFVPADRPRADLIRLLKAAETLLAHENNVDARQQLFASMVASLARLGQHSRVADLLLMATHQSILIPSSLSPRTLLALMTALGETTRIDAAGTVFAIASRRPDNTLTEAFVLSYVKCCLASGAAQRAEEAVRVAGQRGCATSRVFQTLLRHYGKKENWGTVLKLIRQTPPSACFGVGVKRNLLLKIASERGDVEEAEKVLRDTESRKAEYDEYTYFHLLKLYASTHHHARMEALQREMAAKHIRPSTACFVVLIDYYFRWGDVASVLRIFREAKSAGRTNLTLYAQMVRHFTYLGQLDQAMSLFSEMNSHGYADLGVYTLLVCKLHEANRRQDALRVLKDQRPRVTGPRGPLNRDSGQQQQGIGGGGGASSSSSEGGWISSYMALMRCAGQLGALDVAFDLFDSYCRSGESPDSLMYNCLLDACVTCKAPQRAIDFFNKMKTSQVRPDCVTYNTMIRAYNVAKHLDGAFGLLEEMMAKGTHPNVVTFNSLIHACVMNRNNDKAWRVLPLMKTSGVEPDSVTYSTLIIGIKNDRTGATLARGFSCLDQLLSTDMQPDEVLFNSLMDACVHFGEIRKAETVFQRMMASGISPSTVAYGILMKCKGDMEEAGLQSNAVVYGCLIDVALKVGEDAVAEGLFDEMRSRGIQGTVVTYSLLIKLFGRQRNIDKAFAVIEEMKSQGLSPSSVTYNSLMDTLARCRDMRSAPRLLALMRQDKVSPDLITYSTICKGYCHNGELERALDAFAAMKHEGFKADEIIYNSLIDGCARRGDLNTAKKLVQEMRGGGIQPSNVTYSILIKTCGVAKEIDHAFDVLEMMEEDCVRPGKVVYTCLIQACVCNGRLDRAVSVFHDMHARQIFPDGVTYGALIAGCIQGNDLRQAVALTEHASAQGTQLTTRTYQQLLRSLKRANMLPEYQRVDEQMAREGVDNRRLPDRPTQRFGDKSRHHNHGFDNDCEEDADESYQQPYPSQPAPNQEPHQQYQQHHQHPSSAAAGGGGGGGGPHVRRRAGGPYWRHR
ncbi:unnamed protein product [Vitrella brassicaformis CCMP3155]|uniref:Pentacotripeptide-repeat region of PRORP domain-containing protein n=1 Tax=Vitrella brassicaformis (strain CCMP3155) TaxID=1169540 RepID=A0A0G4GYU4_VITBC|nr:unnamed protein product [Vitrella brassicaformis CCMP3155]|eukprot:CEM36110.1 unnamed protein product [Vitrella brassicaformis CCMP3155]